ncbi:MAG: hypothetical protein MJ201_04610 [Mycoplasmoidaceae bacterium]|nr:hypothetical protein [Mycoplasmoidaceae bacterium]
MKRKFILLPIVLTTLAPTISMVSCNESEPTPPTPPVPKPSKLIEMLYEEDGESVYLFMNIFKEEKLFANTTYCFFGDLTKLTQEQFNLLFSTKSLT